jgi:tRNA(Ile)-lysidine synthase
LKSLIAKIQRQRLFEPGETVVVAVSGGADSVALLDILSRFEEEPLRLVVAHLNHGLRGDDSDGDEEFVSQLAARYGFPFESQRADVAWVSRSQKISLEDAGRRVRYRFLSEVAQAHQAASIALAHHRDDQAETVLIRLLRGAGGAGLSAMGSSSQGSASKGSGTFSLKGACPPTLCPPTLKRPLLRISRAEIERYLKGVGLSYRTDASNEDTRILRNSVRHELIPFLARYNPKISERLAATAETLASDQELLEGMTDVAYARVLSPGATGPVLSVEKLADEPRGLRLRLYRRALAELRGDLQRIALAHLEAIDRLIISERPNSRLKLPGECFVSRSYGSLRFSASADPGVAPFELSIAGPGNHPLPNGGSLLVESVPFPRSFDPGSRRVSYLDPLAAPFPWVLRSFAPGDRFTPLGMTGGQKVKELFMNEKIPPDERRRIPLLLSAGRILWVCGVRMGDLARVTAATGPVLRVEILEVTP